MNTGKTLCTQLMDFLPWTTSARYLARYDGVEAQGHSFAVGARQGQRVATSAH